MDTTIIKVENAVVIATPLTEWLRKNEETTCKGLVPSGTCVLRGVLLPELHVQPFSQAREDMPLRSAKLTLNLPEHAGSVLG